MNSLVTNQNQFLEICDQINESDLVAIDTEFVRESTFYPLLCLIQINVSGKVFAIDVLSKNINLQPFFEILENEKILKVFHSTRQDIEALFSVKKFIPRSFFDTQIMANFCNFDYNVSYAGIVKLFFGKDLDKNWQRSDWQRRPLHEDQISYSLIDVIYLPEIYQILKEKLEKENKFEWFLEEMKFIFANQDYDSDQNLFKKFSFIGKSSNYKENVKILIPWRNEMAKKRNVPRGYVIKDELISKIAAVNPQNLEELENCDSQNSLDKDLKKQIFNLLKNKISLIKEEEPEKKFDFRLNEKQEALYQKSRELLIQSARNHYLKPEFIINQSELRNLILRIKQTEDTLKGWRFEVFGKNLLNLIKNHD